MIDDSVQMIIKRGLSYSSHRAMFILGVKGLLAIGFYLEKVQLLPVLLQLNFLSVRKGC